VSELTAMMPSEPLRSARTCPSLPMRKALRELVPQSRPIICGASNGARFAIRATMGTCSTMRHRCPHMWDR